MSEKQDVVDIVRDIQDMAIILGHAPSRDEYVANGKYTRHAIEQCGGFITLLHMAGLTPSRNNKKKIQEIRKVAFEHLQKEIEEKKKLVAPPKLIHHALIIGDLHCPYQHPDAIDFLIALNKKYKFDYVANAGDEVDYHAMSFHDSDPDLLSAGHELEAAIKTLERLYKEFPVMHLADSNHGSMAFRKGKHHGIPRQIIKPYREILRAPEGWTWAHKIKMHFSNGHKAALHHSYGSNILLTSQKSGGSLIAGHIHGRFCVQKWANDDGVYFAAQTGCLIDDVSMAFAYNKDQVERPILGSLRIFNGEPILCPMILDAKGRWTGWVP